MTWTQTITLFSPELILALSGLLVLGFDLALRRRRDAILVYVSLAGLALALLAAVAVAGQSDPLFSGMFTVDSFTLFFRVVAILATGLILLASIDYLRVHTPYQGEFYSLLLFSALAMTLMAGATDLIMVSLSLEFLSLTSYVLTGYLREDPRSNEASIKYLLYGAVTTAVMLYGMTFLYGATGSTNLVEIAQVLGAPGAIAANLRWLALPAMVLLLAGFGFKIALVPFHQWSPDAYEGAPTPVTAFLSVGPKAAGFAMLLRVFLTALPPFHADWAALLMGISIVTMTLGNLVAITQTNIKRMMAYSSIAQAGYILIGLVSLGAGGNSPINGVGSTLLYILAYLFTNLGAFLVIIAFENATGSAAISEYAGLIRRAPVAAAALVVFFLSLAGIPPTAGFVGKFYIFAAAIQSQLYLLAAIGVVNGVISVYYYFNVVRQMFFLPPKDEAAIRLSLPLRLSLVVTLVMTLLIGLYAEPFIRLAQATARVLGG